jgi:hypothetical protein
MTNRYSELLEALMANDGVKAVAIELDAVVGERLAESRDQAIAESLGGALIDGMINLPGSSIDGWGVRTFVPKPLPFNPPFDECGCAWGQKVWEKELERETNSHTIFSYSSLANGERLHDTLLALNGPNPLAAITELLIHIHDEPIPRDLDIANVFAQHNWRDPVVMHDLALELDRVWESVIEKERP